MGCYFCCRLPRLRRRLLASLFRPLMASILGILLSVKLEVGVIDGFRKLQLHRRVSDWTALFLPCSFKALTTRENVNFAIRLLNHKQALETHTVHCIYNLALETSILCTSKSAPSSMYVYRISSIQFSQSPRTIYTDRSNTHVFNNHDLEFASHTSAPSSTSSRHHSHVRSYRWPWASHLPSSVSNRAYRVL